MKFLAWQAQWIIKTFGWKRMMLVGVVMIDISILFAIYLPFSGEKPGVYVMSQLALLFGGIVCVFEAEIVKRQDDDGG